jgi:uncharacterized protein (TIGR03067 family)
MFIRVVLSIVALAVLKSGDLNGQTASQTSAADPKSSATTSASAPDLTGTWLLDQWSFLPNRIINTTIRVEKTRFTIHGFWDLRSDWTGELEFADDGQPSHVMICSNGIDLKEKGTSYGYPKCRLPGIYQLEGDRLTLCFAKSGESPRPLEMKETDHALLWSFVRVPAGWPGLPKTVKITVLDPAGHPAAGAKLFGFMNHMRQAKEKDGKVVIDTTQPAVLKTSASIHDQGPDTVGPDGTLKVPYSRFDDQELPAGAIDTAHHWVGFGPVFPAILRDGRLTIHMQRQRILRGTIGVEGEQKPGDDLPWRAAYLTAFGIRFAFCEAPEGHFEFCVPPGTYSLYTYGNNLISQTREIDVPPGDGDFTVPDIALRPSPLLSLIGKPAPPLNDVEAWKNGEVKFADLKGKVVLIDFWGYWCGNCVADMPEVIRLYRKYKDKGLAVVSVHVDEDGEVDTVEKLDAKTKMYRDGIWKGQDLPFPVALCSGANRGQSGNSARFGVQGYPTAIFLDRAGNVLDTSDQLQLNMSDPKEDDAAIERLLNSK